ncbi:MAG: Uma2 family endonuclease [Acinetobacter sp.]|nr:Uma2 family endonuclease [Acinetobacter sp.]
MTTLTLPINFVLFDQQQERKTFVKKCTVQDFEEFLQQSDEQNYYLLNGQIIQMSNASETHNDILLNFSDHIRLHFRQNGIRCKFHFEMAIEFDSSNKFQPDFSVTCASKKPVIVGEVFSKSTKKEDLEIKLPIYKNQPSIQEICYIEQSQKLITLYTRHHDTWQERVFREHEHFEFKSIGLTLTVNDIYQDVVLNRQ